MTSDAKTENLLRHAGYVGSVEVSLPDGCLHGRILHIRDVISYEGGTVPELQAAFKDAVDRYLAHCASVGKAPDRPYTGSLQVRLGGDRHRSLVELSHARDCPINQLIIEAVDLLLRPATPALPFKTQTTSHIVILNPDGTTTTGYPDTSTVRVQSVAPSAPQRYSH